MQGGGLSPGDGWNVALLFVEVALGAAIALVVLAVGTSLAIYIVRGAARAPLPAPAGTAGPTGQQPAVGAVAPRTTPAGTVPRPAPARRTAADVDPPG